MTKKYTLTMEFVNIESEELAEKMKTRITDWMVNEYQDEHPNDRWTFGERKVRKQNIF